jgi:hypothetical protein
MNEIRSAKIARPIWLIQKLCQKEALAKLLGGVSFLKKEQKTRSYELDTQRLHRERQAIEFPVRLTSELPA